MEEVRSDPGLMFGNVFIGPEPQRGWEADAANLYTAQ